MGVQWRILNEYKLLIEITMLFKYELDCGELTLHRHVINACELNENGTKIMHTRSLKIQHGKLIYE